MIDFNRLTDYAKEIIIEITNDFPVAICSISPSIKFKPTSNFVAGQSTTITLNNVKGSSDSSVTNGTGASKTISVNIPKSSNNNLSSLSLRFLRQYLKLLFDHLIENNV